MSSSAFTTPPPASLKQKSTFLVTASMPAKKKAKTIHAGILGHEEVGSLGNSIGSNETITEKTKKKKTTINITDLPQVSISNIAELTGDMSTVLNIAEASPKLMTAIQPWTCTRCDASIFVVKDATNCDVANDKGRGNAPPEPASDALSLHNEEQDPFICHICFDKFCGQEEKPGCQANAKCFSCDALECEACLTKRVFQCSMCYGEEAFCRDCQGGDSGKSCYLCDSALCNQHVCECFEDDCSLAFCADCQEGAALDTCDQCGKYACELHEGCFQACECGKVLCGDCQRDTKRCGLYGECSALFCQDCESGLFTCEVCNFNVCRSHGFSCGTCSCGKRFCKVCQDEGTVLTCECGVSTCNTSLNREKSSRCPMFVDKWMYPMSCVDCVDGDY